MAVLFQFIIYNLFQNWKARVEGYEEAVKEFTKLKNTPESNEFSKVRLLQKLW